MDSKLAIRQLKALGKMTEGLDIRLAAEWDERMTFFLVKKSLEELLQKF